MRDYRLLKAHLIRLCLPNVALCDRTAKRLVVLLDIDRPGWFAIRESLVDQEMIKEEYVGGCLIYTSTEKGKEWVTKHL